MQTVKDGGPSKKYYSEIIHLADDELDPYEMRLYIHYKRVCGQDGECWETNETTATKTKMSESKVKTTRKALETKGWIECEIKPQGNGKTRVYVALIDRWLENIQKYNTGSPDNPVTTQPRHQITPKEELCKDVKEERNGVTETAPATSPVPATPPPSVHVTAAAIAESEHLETSLLALLERINGAIRKKQSDARTITGTRTLARKLAERGETVATTTAAWQTCKKNAEKPVGAFVFWINQEYLPPPQKGHETQADAQGNQQVWVEGQGWMATGRAA